MLRIKGNTIKLFLMAVGKVRRPLRAAHGPAVLRAEGGFGSLNLCFVNALQQLISLMLLRTAVTQYLPIFHQRTILYCLIYSR